ncbi:MAG: hypothetical protein GXP28_07810, partial [Planctomycetes bacterium]|nr:hypothetical protein [Planctomycetota bacterium]
STFVVPHVDTHHTGSYYVRDGGYFYSPQAPQTLSTGTAHTTAYRPQPVVFGSFSRVDDLASRFATLSNEFCLDLHYNYPSNPGFQETYREAYEILQTAQYIADAEHRHDREAIRGRLGGLDQRFHHVQSDVRGWKRHHHRQVVSEFKRRWTRLDRRYTI